MERSSRGLTLTEVLVVVTILGIVAMVAIPSFTVVSPHRAELAAGTVADALRFARVAAMQTTMPHGVLLAATEQRVQVFRWDAPGGTPTRIFDVRHPVRHDLYDQRLTDRAETRDVAIQTLALAFSGLGKSVSEVVFDRFGLPYYQESGNRFPLTAADITLTDGKQARRISIDPLTGQVAVTGG